MSQPLNLTSYHFILASKSPRRQYLLKEIGLNFETITKEVDESFPEYLKAEAIPLYLCQKKATAFATSLNEKTLVITADTIVWVNDQVLNKPKDYADAAKMLNTLSGKAHYVYTGVCLRSLKKTYAFFTSSKVYFKTLSPTEIDNYIKNYQPFDKAGSYGAQECLSPEMKPCSAEEVRFLTKINKAYLNKVDAEKKSREGVSHYFVEKIEGSYFNVMGLPIEDLYEELLHF